MSNYLSLGITGSGQYSPSIFAGEGYGSSRMTHSLHGMINTAIEMHMQMAITKLITQLLQNIFQPPQNVTDTNDGEQKNPQQQQESCHCNAGNNNL